MPAPSHYNPDEARDALGRWTTSGSSWCDTLLRDPSPAGRAHTLLGHALLGAWQQRVIRAFNLPSAAEAQRFGGLLGAWNAAAHLDEASFRETFTRGLIDAPTQIRCLRQAAEGSALARTMGEIVKASHALTTVIRHVGADRWPHVVQALEDRAEIVMPLQFVTLASPAPNTARAAQTGLSGGDHPQGDSFRKPRNGQSQAPADSPHPLGWDGTHGDSGDNIDLGIIRQQIYEALKNKKAIAIVGGAGDKTLGHVMEDVYRDMQRNNKGINIQYFTSDQDKELKAWLEKQGQTYGSDNIAVVGHSWGGDTAAKVVANGTKVGALITIDPVSHFRPERRDVRANTNNWINVNANPNEAKRATDFMSSNLIAGMGGAWNSWPLGYANYHFNANINHAGAAEVIPTGLR